MPTPEDLARSQALRTQSERVRGMTDELNRKHEERMAKLAEARRLLGLPDRERQRRKASFRVIDGGRDAR
jgi:hypothetical protein